MKPFLAQKAIRRRRARREAWLQAELRRRAAAQPEPSVFWQAFREEWCRYTDEQIMGDNHGR